MPIHTHWTSWQEKEHRLCKHAPSTSEKLNALISSDIESTKQIETLQDFLAQKSNAKFKDTFTLRVMIQHLLSDKLTVQTSHQERVNYIKKVINTISATEQEKGVISNELNSATINDFIRMAKELDIPVSLASVHNAATARLTEELPKPIDYEAANIEERLQNSISAIPVDGQWHDATVTGEAKLGLRYYVLPNNGGVYRCDKSGAWSEKWSNGTWEFSAEYKSSGRDLWQEHKDYMDGIKLRSQNTTGTGAIKYGSEKVRNPDGTDQIDPVTKRPKRKYYTKLNQKFADYIADPVEKEKYLSIPRDGMWHNYSDLDFREGYEKDQKLVRWQYRLHTDGHMYARRPVRVPDRQGYRSRGELTWEVMGYSWNPDGSAQWIVPDNATIARVLHGTLDMSPQPIDTQGHPWARFPNKYKR